METIEVKKPATRLYTSVKMAAHELRTKIIPAWERVNPDAKLSNNTTVSLVLSLPPVDVPPNILVQIDIGRGTKPQMNAAYNNIGWEIEDLRDLIVVVDNPTVKKNLVGGHTVDQLIFTVEDYRVKAPTQPKSSKKKAKNKGGAIVPKQMDLHEYVEELDKRVTESIRSLLEEQDKAMQEKIDQIVDKVDGVKETVDEIKESIEAGFTKLSTMFEKWGEFFTKKTEVAEDSEETVAEVQSN